LFQYLFKIAKLPKTVAEMNSAQSIEIKNKVVDIPCKKGISLASKCSPKS
jgi:hypothetical protein